jgi:hypothetical protein
MAEVKTGPIQARYLSRGDVVRVNGRKSMVVVTEYPHLEERGQKKLIIASARSVRKNGEPGDRITQLILTPDQRVRIASWDYAEHVEENLKGAKIPS